MLCRACRAFSRRSLVVPAAAKRLLHLTIPANDGGNDSNFDDTPHQWGELYPIPWMRYNKPVKVLEPLWNKLTGLFLLRRIATLHNHSFSVAEFLSGVKDAVYTLANVITDSSMRHNLDQLLEPQLCKSVQQSLDLLPQKAHIHLDIESIRALQLSSVNTVVGSTAPGDEHIIALLGQKIITSQARLQDILDQQDEDFTFKNARELGKEATFTRLEFSVAVSFATKEKFTVMDENGRVVMGSNQFQDCYHLWRFVSLVPWGTEDYPFMWTISDINNYRLMLPSHIE